MPSPLVCAGRVGSLLLTNDETVSCCDIQGTNPSHRILPVTLTVLFYYVGNRKYVIPDKTNDK